MKMDMILVVTIIGGVLLIFGTVVSEDLLIFSGGIIFGWCLISQLFCGVDEK